MNDFNETTITEDLIERFAEMSDPRLKAIMTSLVRHLHDFISDIEPTFEEWSAAIDFLTRIGRACTEKRQEYILLSDVLGVTMLIDAINHRMREGATETTVLGPFHVVDPPELPHGADIAKEQPGERLHVKGFVSSSDGRPLADALVDVWQSDEDGYYDVQRPELMEATLRGRFRTDEQGRFAFWSIMPSQYPIPVDGPVGEMLNATRRHPFRPAHIHFMIAAEDHETLITQIFAADSPYLDSDAVFGVKPSLIVEFAHGAPGSAPDGRAGPWRKLTYSFSLRGCS
jgi:hydroxyquinol 1,2-dioxygenase